MTRTPDGAAVLSRLDAMVSSGSVPGLQYLFTRGDQVLLEHCAGMADALRSVPVTPATTFNAYSITKALTATAAVVLSQAGRLDLDSPVGTACGFDGLQAYGTVRETLLHRAGFPNPNPLRWVHQHDEHRCFDEAAFVRERVAGLRSARRRRARYAYSNLGYLLLGETIAQAAGQAYTEFVTRRLIARLNLDEEAALSFAIPDPSRHAHPHVKRFGWLNLLLGLLVDRHTLVERAGPRWLGLRLHHPNGSAYGGLIANGRGLARFARAVLGEGELLTPGVRSLLLTVVPGPGPQRTLGWFAGSLDGVAWLAHAGGGLGYYGELRLYPALDCVSVLLMNRPGLRDAHLLDRIDRPTLAQLQR